MQGRIYFLRCLTTTTVTAATAQTAAIAAKAISSVFVLFFSANTGSVCELSLTATSFVLSEVSPIVDVTPESVSAPPDLSVVPVELLFCAGLSPDTVSLLPEPAFLIST